MDLQFDTRAGSKVMLPIMLNDNLRWDCIFVCFKPTKYRPFTESIQSLKALS